VQANGVEQAEERFLVESMSAMRSPNTVPWPQPVVAVRLLVRSSRFASPLRVVTLTAFTSQSTCTETISSMLSTRRWLRRNPMASASGAAPRVMSVTTSRLST